MTQAVGSDAPPWLVDLVVTPPWWLALAVVLAAGACIAIAVRKIVSDDLYISTDEQRQMLLLVGTGEAVAVGVMLAMNALELSYLPAVVVGLVGGFGVTELARRCDPILDTLTPGSAAKIAVAWAVVGVVAFAAPVIADGTAAARALRIGVGTIAAAMLLWTLFQASGDGDTLGEVVREGRADD